MLEKITFRLSRPRLRFFIYILFSLILLVLIAEGGYLYFTQRRKEAITDWVNLIEGRISEIRGRTLVITVEDGGILPRKVEIEVANDARISTFSSYLLKEEEIAALRNEEKFRKFVNKIESAREPALFTDLKIGDRIQAGSLEGLTKTKFKANNIAIVK